VESVHLVVSHTWTEGEVHLRSWDEVHGTLAHRALQGHLGFRVLAGRHCTGRTEGGLLAPCPYGAAATRGASCDDCFFADAFRPCMTCDGFRCPRLSPDMLRWCRQTHHLYLACFGDSTIKVGTASDPRKNQRIIEQGPLAAARVAHAEGPLVKQMEATLVQAGFSETMRRARKTVLVQGAMSEVEARSLVIEASATLKDVLPPPYHGLLHAPVFVPQPALARQSRGLTVNELRLEDDRVVEGDVVGAIGHLLFLAEVDGTFALDLGELKARRIEWDPAGPRKKAVAQLGLF
jgi:hypothetical protein